MFVLVLVLHRGAVTVSSTGAENLFQGDDNGHVGRPCEVSLAPPYPELFASYGASAVTRTSGRGHVAEAKTNVIEVSGYRDGHRDDTRLGDPLDFGVFISR